LLPGFSPAGPLPAANRQAAVPGAPSAAALRLPGQPAVHAAAAAAAASVGTSLDSQARRACAAAVPAARAAPAPRRRAAAAAAVARAGRAGLLTARRGATVFCSVLIPDCRLVAALMENPPRRQLI
jgi:hypothetical protein